MSRYEKYVEKTCSDFPEGDLFPYTFPAMAYSLLNRDGAKEKVRKLLKIAQLKTEGVVDDQIVDLTWYKDHGTFLGQFNLALSVYLLRYEDKEFQQINDHLSQVLLKAFKEVQYAQINSYPSLTWSFDSIPALLSVKLNRSISAQEKELAVEEHIKWLSVIASDKKTRLPYSVYSKSFQEVPRGCDLSFRLPLLYFLDQGFAKKIYGDYCQFFWKIGALTGFREYQNDDHGEDVDSGPILMGVGATATALSYPCFELFKDGGKKKLYLLYLSQIPMMKSLVENQKSEYSNMLDDEAFTGLFFGDCTLFYALTFHHLEDLIKTKKLP